MVCAQSMLHSSSQDSFGAWLSITGRISCGTSFATQSKKFQSTSGPMGLSFGDGYLVVNTHVEASNPPKSLPPAGT